MSGFEARKAGARAAEPTLITFGCRLNAYESEVMRAHARDAGLTDTIIVNTCAVTAEAERQARKAIRKARRERPTARIIVTGCAAQIDPAKFAAMAEVDQVLGNEEKLRPESFLPIDGPRVRVNDIFSVSETAGHLIEGFEGRARAFVQVQQGCDHRCTFCIIPFGRGNSRSVPMGEVVAQTRKLVSTATERSCSAASTSPPTAPIFPDNRRSARWRAGCWRRCRNSGACDYLPSIRPRWTMIFWS